MKKLLKKLLSKCKKKLSGMNCLILEGEKRYVEAVCKASGWTDRQAEQRMLAAKRHGVSCADFVYYTCWQMTEEEVREFGKVLRDRKRALQRDYQFYIDVLGYKYGWGKERAEKELKRAKKNGFTYQKYMQKAGWNYADDELCKLKQIASKDGQRVMTSRESYIAKIIEATGWNRGQVELAVNRCRNLTGASYEDYFVFKLYEVPEKKQLEYVTLGLFTKMRIKYNEVKPAQANFDHKARFNENFSDLIHRRWFVNSNLTYEDFLTHINGLSSIIVKAMAATQGKGIRKYDVNVSEADNRRIYDEIVAMPLSIVEEYIVQHEAVMAFCPKSVNTIRITTLNDHGECRFLYSVFRTGQGAVVDNFHSGGIAATVDMQTGEVVTDAADVDGRVFEFHPYSGLKIKGFKIPHWDQILDVCRKATGRVPGVNLIGWDFAVTPDGVELIEGNPGASYVVAQIPNVKDRIGLRSVMVDPYL